VQVPGEFQADNPLSALAVAMPDSPHAVEVESLGAELNS
jgi:hypothetical protein